MASTCLESLAALEQPGLVALPVAILLDGALVVLLLALGESDLELCPATLPIELERHDGVPLALYGADQPAELAVMHEELACTDGICDHVAGGGRQRRDVRAYEE